METHVTRRVGGSIIVFLVIVILGANAVTDEQALLWTQKDMDGTVRVMGIPGNPQDWIDNGLPKYITYGEPGEALSQHKSVRTTLGFQHYSKHLFFSDIGYREIFKMDVVDTRFHQYTMSYNVSMEAVYSGISTQIRSMAVDWQAGTIYWTDALYNWITVAAVDKFSIFRHIITTGLDEPIGVAVFPQKGLLFWTDQGSTPKIERSNMDGSDRTVMVSGNVVKPTGITIDYAEEQVFWIDDGQDMVFRMDLDGGNIDGFPVKDAEGSPFQYLYGITVFQNFLFLSDQFMSTIKIYDRNLEVSRGEIPLTFARPYDVMMYDSSLQEEFESDCDTLECDHMCINMGNAGARCLCSQDYTLQSDGVTCNRSEVLSKPQYIYSIGSKICSTHVRKPNLDGELHSPTRGLQCFDGNVSHAEALAADVYGSLLFFSDTNEGTIKRLRLVEGHVTEDHVLQTGDVRGLAVDWINYNLYWADQTRGHIMVSKYDGRLPKILVNNLYQPRALVVDPINGYMFWSTVDAIYRANMDGTEPEVFVNHEVHNPDGMVINYLEERLYWVDTSEEVRGISSINLNGTDKAVLFTSTEKTFRDITFYQDFVSWTDGEGTIYFAQLYREHITDIRGISHTEKVSHDIITYDDSSQPLMAGPCDIDNGGCSQLCLAVPDDRTCHCTIGFHLDSDLQTCTSEIKDNNFVIFADPLHKSLYQLDPMLQDTRPPVEGIQLGASALPTLIAYDIQERTLYWYDSEVRLIKRRFFQDAEHEEYAVLESAEVGAMDIDQKNQFLYFTDTASLSIKSISLADITSVNEVITGPVLPEAFAVDVNSGYILWATMSSSGVGYSIYRSTTDKLPDSILLVDNVDKIRGLTVDSKDNRVYWWDNTAVHSVTLQGNDEQLHNNIDISSLLSIAAFDRNLFISDAKKQFLVKYDTDTHQSKSITESLYSGIQSVKVFVGKFKPKPTTVPPVTVTKKPRRTTTPRTTKSGKPVTPAINNGSPGGLSSTEKTKDNTMVLAIACSVSAVVVAIIIIVIVVILRRRRVVKQPTPTPHEVEAHENPTYMRADAVPARPVTTTELPPTPPDNYPTKDGAPFQDNTAGARPMPPIPESVPDILPMGASVNPAQSDTAVLVRHMADQSEITLSVNKDSAVAAYTPDKADSTPESP